MILGVILDYIAEKAPTDDRWHVTITQSEIIVNMAMSLYYVNLDRKCAFHAVHNIEKIISYVWFLPPFWLSTKQSLTFFSTLAVLRENEWYMLIFYTKTIVINSIQ